MCPFLLLAQSFSVGKCWTGGNNLNILKKFKHALHSYAEGQGNTGIKGMKTKIFGSKTYHCELKILCKGGAARLYGKVDEKGQVIFELFKDDH